MKNIAIVLASVFIAGCASQSDLTVVGSRTASGAPVGDFRILKAGHTRAQGRFENGKMQGKWLFFSSNSMKLAEVSFQNDVASGPYKTYFGLLFDPSAAGRLESEGHFQNGRVSGLHLVYAPDGSVCSRATFNSSGVREVNIGSRKMAERTAEADVHFVETLRDIVLTAIK